jgi:diguanylate cyclase (GGDEF)-like protein/PAS domain S-box-containing protein
VIARRLRQRTRTSAGPGEGDADVQALALDLLDGAFVRIARIFSRLCDSRIQESGLPADLLANGGGQAVVYGADRVDQWLLGALLDQTDDLIVALNQELRLTFVSLGVQRTIGRSAGRLLGLTVVDAALFGPHARRVHERLAQALEARGSVRFELEWNHGEAGARIYDIRIVAQRPPGDTRGGVLLRAQDITDHRRIEQDLRLREREFRTLAENSPDNIIRYGMDCRAVYCNREIEERVTVMAHRIVGRTPCEAAPPGMMGCDAYEQQVWRTLTTGERCTVELQVPHPNGEIRVHSIVITAERNAQGEICGALAVGRDVTEQVRIRQALAEKEREFRSLAENAGDNIMRWDTEGRVRYLNPAMVKVLGVPAEQVLGKTANGLRADSHLHPVDHAVRRVVHEGHPRMLQLRMPGAAGGPEQVHEIRLVPEHDEQGKVCSVLGIGRDITEQIAQMELIESLVRTDSLTRLANRQALQERAPIAFAAAARRGSGVGVMVLDLDQFKAINDGMGHSAGDDLLCEVAGRLNGCLRVNDLLVRLGGDEFVILAADVADARSLAAIATKVHGALSQPLMLARREVRVTASIGVAIYPNDGASLEQLLAHADSAMYHAKRLGRGRTEYYRAELSEAVQRRLLLEESMREACMGEGLVLFFQPQVSLHRPHSPVGAEALLRWRHPTLGMLTPDAFIQLAEETGMIVPMGRWVLETAARTAVRWNRELPDPLCISVNVSTRQFMLDNLPDVVDDVLARTGCNPRWLSIEITESALLEDSTIVQQALEAFRVRGMQIAIDDFGTGYSALNYLGRFHVDCMKIDKSFVQAIGRSSRDGELVKAFVAMASALNLSTVAEGIETDEQAAFLLAHGCRHAQGYRFGRPMPQAQFESEVLRAAILDGAKSVQP